MISLGWGYESLGSGELIEGSGVSFRDFWGCRRGTGGLMPRLGGKARGVSNLGVYVGMSPFVLPDFT